LKDILMAESIALTTKPRKDYGKQHARRLRRQGLVPAVIYGHKEATVSLALPSEDLQKAIRHGARVVDVQAGGKVEKALIKEVQWDHLGLEILHVDFARVAVDERIEVNVRVEIRGTAIGIAAGGVIDQPMHLLPVECLAMAVPDSIRVNVSELQLEQAIHVRELVLPEGVKALADPDAVVVQIVAKQLEPEVAPAPAEGAAPEQAEPEVIRREKPVEEEEAEPKK
jgi:large subunit ribosomal protein L25